MSDPASQPVFVVGGPRSGTTLLAAMLAAHPAFDCGPETHCLSRWARLGPRERARILDERDWPVRATRYVCSLTLGKRPVHALFGLTESDVRSWLATRPPTLASLLESLTEQRAARAGRRRWVEKTPRHLEVPELIAETWPGARIVRIVRDPRDAAVSLTRVPFGTPSLLTNLSVLARMNESGAAFFRTSPQALTLRYEDLVAEPERELRRLCAFVGEDFDPAMIHGREDAGRVAAEHEWWKGDATGPLDRSRVGQWRTEMPPAVQRYAALEPRDVPRRARLRGGRGAASDGRDRAGRGRARRTLRRRPPATVRRRHRRRAARAGAPERARRARSARVLRGRRPARPGPKPADGRARRRARSGSRSSCSRAGSRAGRRSGSGALTLVRRHRRDAAERVMARILQVLTRPAEASDLPRLLGIDDRSASDDR